MKKRILKTIFISSALAIGLLFLNNLSNNVFAVDGQPTSTNPTLSIDGSSLVIVEPDGSSRVYTSNTSLAQQGDYLESLSDGDHWYNMAIDTLWGTEADATLGFSSMHYNRETGQFEGQVLQYGAIYTDFDWAVHEALQNDGYFEHLQAKYESGSLAADEANAYEILCRSNRGRQYGLGMQFELQDIIYDITSHETSSLTRSELLARIESVLSESIYIPSDIYDELSMLVDYYNSLPEEFECPDGQTVNTTYNTCECPDGQELNPENPNECIVDCDESAGYGWNGYSCECMDGWLDIDGHCEIDVVGTGGEGLSVINPGMSEITTPVDITPIITDIPTITLEIPTITPPELPTLPIEQCDEEEYENKYKAMGDAIYQTFKDAQNGMCADTCSLPCVNYMNGKIMEYNQSVNSALSELSGTEFGNITEEYFTETLGIRPQGEGIETNGITWKYYIFTDLQLVSNVSSYEDYGLTGVVGSASIKDEFGNSSAYGYAIDIDGKILKDSVAKSTQTAYATNSSTFSYVVNGNVVNTKFIVRLQGNGTNENYTTVGFIDILESESSDRPALQYLVGSSRQKDDTKSSVNVNSQTETYQYGNSDTLKSICQIIVDKMYDVNTNSFIFNYNELAVNVDADAYRVLASATRTGQINQFTENDNGYPRTWTYSVDQVVVKNDGTTIPIDYVLSYNLYTLSDLIDHGFVCYINGQEATSDEAQNVTINPEDISDNGTHSDENGVIRDNDNDEVIPDDGIDRDAYAVMDGTANLDLENAYSEYIYSSNNYNYYIPEGVNEHATIVFTDEDGTQETLTIAEALAKRYFNPDEMVEAMGAIGVDVIKVAKTSTTPDFTISIKDEENADTILTEFYRDNTTVYKLEGSTMESRVVIITADGRKLRLRYVLDHNMYTIDQLINKGLVVYKTLATEEVQKDAVLTNNTNYNVTVDNNILNIELKDEADSSRVWKDDVSSRVNTKNTLISDNDGILNNHQLTFNNVNKETIEFNIKLYSATNDEMIYEAISVSATLDNGQYTYVVNRALAGGIDVEPKESILVNNTNHEASVNNDTLTIQLSHVPGAGQSWKFDNNDKVSVETRSLRIEQECDDIIDENEEFTASVDCASMELIGGAESFEYTLKFDIKDNETIEYSMTLIGPSSDAYSMITIKATLNDGQITFNVSENAMDSVD